MPLGARTLEAWQPPQVVDLHEPRSAGRSAARRPRSTPTRQQSALGDDSDAADIRSFQAPIHRRRHRRCRRPRGPVMTHTRPMCARPASPGGRGRGRVLHPVLVAGPRPRRRFERLRRRLDPMATLRPSHGPSRYPLCSAGGAGRPGRGLRRVRCPERGVAPSVQGVEPRTGRRSAQQGIDRCLVAVGRVILSSRVSGSRTVHSGLSWAVSGPSGPSLGRETMPNNDKRR